MLDFKGSQFEREIILWGVRGYVAYPLRIKNSITSRLHVLLGTAL